MRWLDWMMESVDTSENLTRYRWLVVCNDGTGEVVSGLQSANFDWVDFRYQGNPENHYIRKVYAAWNEGVLRSTTPLVILANSDMRFTDFAVDELVFRKRNSPKSLPCSLLVENGRIPSGMPEYVRDFGTTPDNFQSAEFIAHAASIRRCGEFEPGRLFQPVIVDRQEFFDLGSYPDGNHGGISGDRSLFVRYVEAGFAWETCLGSVVAHCQEGEMRWP